MRIKIITYLLLLFSLSVPINAQTKRALVIGLGDYCKKMNDKTNIPCFVWKYL